VLFLKEFQDPDNKDINDVFTVLGIITDIEYDDKNNPLKYGRSNLFNNNYLI
jgi:hypothetical protein